MPDRVVVIGASMGGIAALRVLLKGLPGDFPVPVCIVLHTSPQGPGLLAEVLNPATKLDVVRARDEEPLEEGRVYVAPPDYHLLVERERLCVTKGPKENRFRPAIDPLFRSAAQAFGANAIGIVLTGLLDDGTSGLAAIKRMGGVAVVQDPADAPYPSMPRNALEHVDVDYSAPVVDIPPLLVELTRRPAPAAEEVAPPAELDTEVRIAKEENPMEAGLERIAKPSRFACPECHGVLLQLDDNGHTRFRCHTGHAFSSDALLAALSENVEAALWGAIRALEEAALFLDALSEHARTDHRGAGVAQLTDRANEALQHAQTLREIVTSREPLIREEPKTTVR